MRTKSKIWLGVGAFALVQAAGVSYEAGRPILTVAQTAEASGICGWSKNDRGRWYYDGNCERGERYVPRPGYYQSNERGERWNERGERWNERGERWNERGERWNERDRRWEHGDRWENGRDRWGERG